MTKSKHTIYRFLLFTLLIAAELSAVVGDWGSYGSRMNWRDLQLKDNEIWAGTDGGLLRFDLTNTEIYSNTDGLDHIDISALKYDAAGRFWIGYDADPSIVSSGDPVTGQMQHFDLGFTAVRAFAGDSTQMLALYDIGQASGIAHFIVEEDRVVFRDVYDQFDPSVQAIYCLELQGDSIFIGTNDGLYGASLDNPNLKPASAWRSLLKGGAVTGIAALDDGLYFNSDTRLFRRQEGVNTLQTVSVGTGYPLRFDANDNGVYMIYHKKLWMRYPDSVENPGGWFILEEFEEYVNDLLLREDGDIIVSLLQKGMVAVDPAGVPIMEFIPNSPLAGVYQALDIDPERGLYLANGAGISRLGPEGHWHNIVRSDTVVSTGHALNSEAFSADTVAFTYFGGYIFDMLISTAGKAYVSYSGVHTDYTTRYPISYTPVVKPGPLWEMDLDDPSRYTVYDTTGGVFDGSEASIGGLDEYVVARGMTESADGSVWVINAHASNGEPLIRIHPGGELQKYSIEGSGGVLQALPNEMVCDNYNRVWIANQYHPDNAPLTKGGISIYDLDRDQWFDMNRSEHGLVNDDVMSIDADPEDGSIWIATAGGVQMISPPSALSSATADERLASAVHEPIEGIGDITVTKVRVDIRGNKWILSSDGGVRILQKNGLWYNGGSSFTRENSPLLSNTVTDVVFDDRNALAWIVTDKGLNRLETGWAQEYTDTEEIIIFPQPFDSRIHETLYFDRLPDQSEILITALTGKLLYRIPADDPMNYGRQAAWPLVLNGRSRLAPGVYFAFIYNVDGLKRTLKFAVKD